MYHINGIPAIARLWRLSNIGPAMANLAFKPFL